MDWGLAGAVILSGLVIVFLILVILILLVSLTSRFAGGDKPKESGSAPVAQVVSAPAVTAAQPVVQAGIDEETVAVISAAVYSCMDSATSGMQYAIRGIKRAAGERPVWGFAGMQQNTRPF